MADTAAAADANTSIASNASNTAANDANAADAGAVPHDVFDSQGRRFEGPALRRRRFRGRTPSPGASAIERQELGKSRMPVPESQRQEKYGGVFLLAFFAVHRNQGFWWQG